MNAPNRLRLLAALGAPDVDVRYVGGCVRNWVMERPITDIDIATPDVPERVLERLKRAGINVNVYERDRTRADGLQGYRVGINPHGLASLEGCLPPELYATFLATCARTPGRFNILTERMTELLTVPLEDESMSGGKSVSRMTLRQVLLTGLEAHVHSTSLRETLNVNAEG